MAHFGPQKSNKTQNPKQDHSQNETPPGGFLQRTQISDQVIIWVGGLAAIHPTPALEGGACALHGAGASHVGDVPAQEPAVVDQAGVDLVAVHGAAVLAALAPWGPAVCPADGLPWRVHFSARDDRNLSVSRDNIHILMHFD